MIPFNFTKASASNPSRREFLIGAAAVAGAFVLGTYIPFAKRAFAQEGGGVPKGIFDPNVFLKIGADNTVTLISKHFEMGQGVTTGLATLVAEELDADWSSMRIEFAPNNAKLYNNLAFGPVMGTGGSTSTPAGWEQMRQVGAAARMMLVSAAAAKWNVPAAEIKVQKGVLSHAKSGKKATFGKLAGDAMRVPVPAEIADDKKRSAAETSLAYMGLKGGEKITDIAIDRVFIGSCTNGRLEDLRAAAKMVAGKKVNSHVNAMVVPGSGIVKEQAEAEGLDKIFLAAGFEWREPGCSMCLAMNPDKLQPGERCASTSNRNFEGRQGYKGRTHLVSPAMAAAAAIAGKFVDVRNWR